MFPYTVKYIESEYDIQNNNLLYKIPPQNQNTFEMLDVGGKLRKVSKTIFYFIVCINSIIHFV